ncbi:MAG TPA: hypothetical protein VHM25_24475, partial [Polyangiaceae bacterium]|nr:hypothetical protein [Polyangiaceae bacterium]
LSLPSPGIGPAYTRAHAALGNRWLEGQSFERGVRLRFEAKDEELAQHPWQLTLTIREPARARPVLVPIDLRTLLFLPLAAFIGLALAAPLGSARRNARVLGQGLLILVPALLVLTALPLLSFLGGTGPVLVFRLAPALHLVLQTVYRALVAPPGMMYALPLLLWWALVARLEPHRPTSQPSSTQPQSS